MKHSHLRGIGLSDLLLFGGTRVALGAGIGLLLSRRLNKDHRSAAGLALVIVGGATTIPLAMRFRALRRWKQDRSEGGSHCACGCEYCCPPEASGQPTPQVRPA